MLNRFKIDKALVLYIVLFFVTSIISIYCASMYLSPSLGNLVIKQSLWYIIGIIFIIAIIKLKNQTIYKYTWYIYLANLVLLAGLLFLAPTINGSKCWYVISGIGSFQPSEFMKISLILMIAKTIDNFKQQYKNPTLIEEFKLICIIFIIYLIPSILTFLEPDTGAVLIYTIITILMLFISGIRIRWFLILFSIILIFLTSFLVIYFFNQDLFINIFGSSFFYRIDRIINWQSGSGMQLTNSLSAIGSSGLLGHGFNKTPLYFPEAGTDFIFAVFSSNFGLIGSLALILLITLFDLKLINIGRSDINKIDKYVIIGIIGILFYQQVQNISMTIGLLPITGITLPFISYGGSSLISYMILLGLIFNIYNSIYNKEK